MNIMGDLHGRSKTRVREKPMRCKVCRTSFREALQNMCRGCLFALELYERSRFCECRQFQHLCPSSWERGPVQAAVDAYGVARDLMVYAQFRQIRCLIVSDVAQH